MTIKAKHEIDPFPSLGTLDPMARIMAAAVCRALADLRSTDLFKALDAFIWLGTDGDIWMQALGFPVEDALTLAIQNTRPGKQGKRVTNFEFL